MKTIYAYIAAVALFAVYGIVGHIDYQDAKAAEAHKRETVAAAKKTAKLEKQAHSMLSLDRIYAMGETK